MTAVVGRGQAHGKIILFGEHAVVHGVPALVCGISRGLRAEARAVADGPSRLQLLQRHTHVAEEAELARALAALLSLAPVPPPLELTVSGDLPPGVGLGFSASAAVALARAVEASVSQGAADAAIQARVAQRANAWEGVFHGNPSGVDVAAAMHQGCLRFVRGEAPEPLTMGSPLDLVVGFTGTRASTRDMVARVAEYLETHPQAGAERLRAIAALVAQGRAHIEAGEVAALGPLMDENQRHLAALGVSCASIETMCALARTAGGLGAKLTGSGGGGTVIALAADEASAARVKESWQKAGYEAMTTRVGESANNPTSNLASDTEPPQPQGKATST